MGDSPTPTVTPTATRTRPAWLPLVAAAIVVPTALAGLTLLWPRPQIEQQLTRDAGNALAAAGFSGAGVTLNGRDATINGVADAGYQAAIDAVQAVPGVRIAGFPAPGAGGGPGPGAVPGSAPAPLAAQPFGIARQGDALVLTGVAGSEAERAALVDAATAKAGGHTVVDQLAVTPGATLPGGVDAAAIGAAAATLGAAAGDMTVSITPDKLLVRGAVADDAAKAAAEQALHAAVPGTGVDDQLTVAAPAAPAGLDAAAKGQLQRSIDALLAAAPITFGPDSPQLTAQGRDTVTKVIALLHPANGAALRVDGYVAAGPGNGKLTAQQLSDQRAATVHDALVAGGLTGPITAQGLGEGTTPADRALGRRVVITLA